MIWATGQNRHCLDLLIEPLKRVVLSVNCAVLETAVLGVGLLLRMEAMERGLLVLALVTQPEEDVGRPVSRQRGNLDTAEDVRAVRRRADADLVEVVGCEGREVCVA